MLALLQAIPLIGKLFGTIDNVTNALRDLQVQKLKAGTEKEKAEIQKQIEQLQAIASVHDSDNKSSNPINAIARTIIFVIPTGAILWKYAYDKAVGPFYGCSGPKAMLIDECSRFRTDSIDPNVWTIILAVASFFLLQNLIKR